MDANLSFTRLESQVEPISKDEYETRLGSMVSSIESMLDISLVKDGKANKKHPLGKVIVEIINLHIQGNYYNRDIELKRLFGFVNDLRKIKEKFESHFMQHRKLLRKCTRLSQFVGLRFEVSLSATFVKKGLEYKNTESPDFEFSMKTSGETAFIESTSCHFTQLRDGDMYNKVANAIRTKSKKKYANSETILIVDFTNVMHSAAISGSEFKVEKLVERLSDVIEASDYGAFIFTGVHTNPDDGWLYSGGDSYIKATASKGVIELYSALGWADRQPSFIEHGTVFSY